MMTPQNSSPTDSGAAMETFFRRFEALTAAGDVDGLAALYAPVFLMAGPAGAQVVKAADMLQAIPRRKQLFDAAGCRSTTLRSVRDEPLGGRYSLVRTEWEWTFERDGRPPTTIALPASYVVERAPEATRIVCYVNDADIVAMMRERGLIGS